MNEGLFQKIVIPGFCDCDYKKRAKLATIMAYMADIAGNAYADKGYSHSWLWENGFVFLLSRVSVHFERMPVAEETLIVHTWEVGTKGVLFCRDFEIEDSNGEIIISAQTQWILANPHTRQILRPNAFTGKIHPHPERRARANEPQKIKMAQIDFLGERKIVYSDIDANGHVYNAVYAAIAYDYLPLSLLERELTDFCINFKQEAKLGETLSILFQQEENHGYLLGKLQESVSFECEFTFAHIK